MISRYGHKLGQKLGLALLFKNLSLDYQQHARRVIGTVKYQNSSRTPILTFDLWALGVHRKTSNVGTYGELGKLPLIFDGTKLFSTTLSAAKPY